MNAIEQEQIFKLQKAFQANRNPEEANKMEAYMKNKFTMFGIKAGPRREISKSFQVHCSKFPKSYKVEIARYLNTLPEREFHHVAQELLEKGYKKNVAEDDIYWIAEFITTNSWWDTVDFIAPKIAGAYFLKFPEKRKEITGEWLASGNLWLIRSAILFQLKYKDKTDVNFLFEIILKTCSTNEFFINKAIGWVLRENSRRIPTEIREFIKENKTLLAPLSMREGLRLIS